MKFSESRGVWLMAVSRKSKQTSTSVENLNKQYKPSLCPSSPGELHNKNNQYICYNYMRYFPASYTRRMVQNGAGSNKGNIMPLKNPVHLGVVCCCFHSLHRTKRAICLVKIMFKCKLMDQELEKVILSLNEVNFTAPKNTLKTMTNHA